MPEDIPPNELVMNQQRIQNTIFVLHVQENTKKTGMQQTGKIIIVAGLILIVVGIIVYFAGDKLNFLGRLPGDIRVEKENFRLYVPITTMILISIVGSVLIRIFQKFF